MRGMFQKTTPENKGGSSSFYHLFSGRFGGFYDSFLAEKARAAWVLSASAGGTGTFSAPAATRSTSANAHKALPFLLRNGKKFLKLHRK